MDERKETEYENDVTPEAIEELKKKVEQKHPNFYEEVKEGKWKQVDGPAW